MITETANQVLQLHVTELHPSEHNPRSDLGDLDGLIASIKVAGVIEPLIVEQRNEIGDYDLIAGHRRLAAAIAAGLATVPCIERSFASQAERIEIMTIENLQRADLSPLDEARAFGWLADLGHTQRDIAERVGCNQSHVSKRLSLVKLPAAATELLTAGRLTLHQAEELARVDEADVDDVVTVVVETAGNPAVLRGDNQELPGWAISDAVDRVARKRKVAAAEETAKKSGLKRLKSKPYEYSGDHRPCKRKDATHVYVDGVSIIWARTAAAEHKANGTFDAAAAPRTESEWEWERRNRERDAVITQRSELLDELDPEVVDAVGIRELLAELGQGQGVHLAPINVEPGEDPLHVVAYAYLSGLVEEAMSEPTVGYFGYDDAIRVRAVWAELAETLVTEAAVAELVPVVEDDMFAEPAPAEPIVEGVGGPTLIFGEPVRPEWATKLPWPTYAGHVMHRLLRRIGDITEPDLLRHVMAYEAAHTRPDTAEVVSAVVRRVAEIG